MYGNVSIGNTKDDIVKITFIKKFNFNEFSFFPIIFSPESRPSHSYTVFNTFIVLSIPSFTVKQKLPCSQKSANYP